MNNCYMTNGVINYDSMAQFMNHYVATDYFTRLMLISRSIYKWEGLPEGIKEKHIENYLFSEGKCVFFKDDLRGFMVAKCSPNGRLNNYNEPSSVIPVAHDLPNQTLIHDVDCVVIQNNDESIPTCLTTQLFAYKLAKIDRTIDVNIEGQKTPFFIACNDRQRMSYRNAMKQRSDNEFLIWVDKNFDTEGINSVNTQSPIVFDKLEIQKHNVWNEYFTYLGLNNANQDKRERLVADEVAANNEQVEACFNTGLKARQEAADLINKIFGLNIRVSKRIKSIPKLSDSEGSEDLPKASEGEEGVKGE